MPIKRYNIGDTVKLNNKKCIVVRDNDREVCGISDNLLFNDFMALEKRGIRKDTLIHHFTSNINFVLKLKSYNFKNIEYKYCKMLLTEIFYK